MLRRLTMFLILMGLGSSLQAAKLCGDEQGFGVYLDQDMLVPLTNQDRDYTMGLAFEFYCRDENVFLLDDGVKWFVSLANRLGLEQNTADKSKHSIMAGAITYTPDDLSDSAPILDDRPYSSLIYVGTKHVWTNEKTAFGVELQLGLLGTGAAREVQRGLHRWYRESTNSSEPVDPRGWEHQISDGGEATARLRLARTTWIDGEAHLWDISRTWDLSLGYQTNASFGLTGRLGHPGHAFWSVPYDPINRGNFLPSFDDEWYLWAAYRARLVAYDVLLQGQFRDSDVTFSGGDIQRLVHEGGVGVTWAWKPVQLSLALNAKTAELKSPVRQRTHVWGGVYGMFRF